MCCLPRAYIGCAYWESSVKSGGEKRNGNSEGEKVCVFFVLFWPFNFFVVYL